MQLILTLPLPPSVNEYLGYRVVYANGRAISQPFETKKAKEYKHYVKAIVNRELKKQNWSCINKDNYINIEMTYYLNKKRKDSHNLEKVLFDSLMFAGVYPDDDILIPKTNNIYIDKYNPRVEVILTISNKQGIFNNARHLEEFKEKNCLCCKKHGYKRSCTILSKALENRIEPNLNLVQMICNEKKSL